MSVDLVFIVPHTHWDREWYRPFEQFRMQLVRVVDQVLAIMRRDPAYERFTLDGQSIILDDYFTMRPEAAPAIRELVGQGRLAVGPWYVLPDEFLVSGEALIRNLEIGRRKAAACGGAMPVGYLPDSFGHIAQMPQILRGFRLDAAMLSRGLGDEGEALGSEFWWEAPDGSRVLCVHQVHGYCNLVALGYRLPSDLFEGRPPDAALAVDRVRREITRLAPYARTGIIVLNNGCDHQPASAHLPQVLARVRDAFPHLQVRWSTPADVTAEILSRRPDLGAWTGELRGSRYAPLIPGVLSTRVYIKQANDAAQRALERWAEPLCALAWALGDPDATRDLHHAWELLLQNHPHDSICGCSVDAVHREMLPRFARVEQIAEDLTRRALRSTAERVGTEDLPAGLPLLVFNTLNWPRTEPAHLTVDVPPALARHSAIVDAAGRPVPCQITRGSAEVLVRERIPANQFAHRIWWLSHEVELAWGVRFAGFSIRRDRVLIDAADPGAVQADVIPRLVRALAGRQTPVDVQVRRERLEMVFLAADVPPLGYRVFVLSDRRRRRARRGDEQVIGRGSTLENRRVAVRLEPDGTVTIRDKAHGAVYRGHLLEDAGDAGDEYDYSPVDDSPRSSARRGRVETIAAGPVEGRLRIHLPLRLPVGLARDRRRRERRTIACPVTIEVALHAASPRVEFSTLVDNRARDHRLRVRFPTAFAASEWTADTPFSAVTRSLQRPTGAGWAQAPQPTAPHESWLDLSDGRLGLAVLSAGLHEHEVLREPAGLTAALTLLRCVGWLSRDDLRTRAAHAGPGYETPEAQCQGVHAFRYAALPHRGSWEIGDVVREALAFRVPLRTVPTTRHKGRLPAAQSFLRVEGAVVSAVQVADDGGLLVRVYNPTPSVREATLRTTLPVTRAGEVNLAGDDLGALALTGGAVMLTLREWQIRTVKFAVRGEAV